MPQDAQSRLTLANKIAVALQQLLFVTRRSQSLAKTDSLLRQCLEDP